MADGKAHSALCVEEAEETVKELLAALARAGIILPFIELGRCSVDLSRGTGEGAK